jgi:chemotaxis protein MotB
MALARARRRDGRTDFWPGFVDAMATLLLVIIFLLSVFMLAQFFLSQEITGRDTALSRLNLQVAELTELLAMERAGTAVGRGPARLLRESLASAEDEQTGCKASSTPNPALRKALEPRSPGWRASSTTSSASAGAPWLRLNLLNQQIAALRRQIGPSRPRSKHRNPATGRARRGSPISGAGSMWRWPSACRSCRATAPTSSAACAKSSASAPTCGWSATGSCSSRRYFSQAPPTRSMRPARANLRCWPAPFIELQEQIPEEIDWIIRVDGHTDARPISGPRFQSNWELSTARAIAVVRFLMDQGVSPNRLVAAGFAENRPLQEGDTEEAYQVNRRIEFKLTER